MIITNSSKNKWLKNPLLAKWSWHRFLTYQSKLPSLSLSKVWSDMQKSTMIHMTTLQTRSWWSHSWLWQSIARKTSFINYLIRSLSLKFSRTFQSLLTLSNGRSKSTKRFLQIKENCQNTFNSPNSSVRLNLMKKTGSIRSLRRRYAHNILSKGTKTTVAIIEFN